MIALTTEVLKNIAPGGKKTNFKLFPGLVDSLNKWMPVFEIDTKPEICHFIAQCAHESDSFNILQEYASGKAYEGRKDLGNIYKGDGVRYKGRGAIQTTGRSNYRQLDIEAAKYFKTKVSFENNPELLLQPDYGIWGACVFWDKRDLNTFANMVDTQKIYVKKLKEELSPVEYISYRVNGGFNGLSKRKEFYERAKTIIV